MRRRNKGLMIGGLVMIPVGLGFLIGGITWVANVNAKPSHCTSAGDGCPFEGIGRAMGRMTGTIVAVGGGMMIAGGIVMASVGGQMVPKKPKRVPTVGVGPGSMTLAWTF